MPTPIKNDRDKRSKSQPLSGAPRHNQMREVKPPNAESAWHPRAKAWFNSLKKSGQSDYFQQSDWELAKFCADLMSYAYEQKFQRMTMLIVEINSMMARLGTTEADRRQAMRVELDIPVVEEQTAEEAAIDEVAAMLSKGVGG